MNISKYLTRIGLSERPKMSVDGLHVLQEAHMRHVPFENLDILIGRALNLSPESLFEKIVDRSRGGYCFELNTLYARLLSELGFAPVPMLARVWLRDPVDVPPRTHLVYRVEIDGENWVTDVGFGGRASRVPLKMSNENPVDDGDGMISIRPDVEFGYRVQRDHDGVISDQYTVEAIPAHLSDILSGNHWTECHPDSQFRQGVGVGVFTLKGRTSFYNGVLTHRGSSTQTRPVSNFPHIIRILKTEFGIDLQLTETEAARLKAFL
jgi:N-hydroxyarylamine O-acetyltransferase